MSYKPSDFFVGVVDFFGVIMPGAVATYLLTPSIAYYSGVFGLKGLDSGPSAWAAFAVGAYVTGHLVYLVGALLDYAYDPVRVLFKPPEKDALYLAATKVKQKLLGTESGVLNTYKFAKALLQFYRAGASAEVARLEADSKFFRSLSVVIAGSFLAYRQFDATLALTNLVLLLLCLWRYGERRWQSTQAAYAYLVTHSISTDGADGSRAEAPPDED